MEPKEKVYFHPTQVEYLEKVFSNSPLPVNATEAELRHKNGQQSVIQFVREKMRSS